MTVIIDNMALSSAVRLLDGDDLQTLTYHRQQWRRGNKWNYAANADVQIALSVMSLAQLVQSIVLEPNIIVTKAFSYRWGAKVIEEAGIQRVDVPESLVSAKEMFAWSDLTDFSIAQLLVESFERALELGEASYYTEFLAQLGRSGAYGAYIDMTDTYFETGYSGPNIEMNVQPDPDTGRNSVMNEVLLWCNTKHAEILVLMENVGKLLRMDGSSVTPADGQASRLARRARAVQRALEHYRPYPGQSLLAASVTEIDGTHSKAAAGPDVIAHIAATLFYGRISSLSRVTYVPHPIRTPLVLGNDPIFSDNPSPDAELVRLAESIRAGQAKFARNRPGRALYDVYLPLVLSYVLKSCTSPADITEVAMLLREDKKTARLRQWSADLQENLQVGVDLNTCRKLIEKVEREVGRWLGTASPQSTFRLGLSSGIASISKELHLPTASSHAMKHELRFLYDISRFASETASLKGLLAQSFGSGFAESWARGNDILSSFERGNSRGLLSLMRIPSPAEDRTQ